MKTSPARSEKMVFSRVEFQKIQWEEKYCEFEMKGKLYDVSEIRKTKEGYEVYCVNDSEEESIAALFNEWKKINWPVNKTKIQIHPLFSPNPFLELGSQNQNESIVVCESNWRFQSGMIHILTPPPERLA